MSRTSSLRTKRAFDLLLALLLLVPALPLMAVIALALRLALGTPVLFAQVRPGLRGEPFTIWKFRTMSEARGADGALLADNQRLTPLGGWLRGSSLDELPELFNVIRGDMSFVGPRPLLMEYLPRYTPRQARRHEVLPGITGLAQVRGRNLLRWEDRFELDVWYVEHRSMRLDLQILLWTLLAVIRREGINQPGHATAAKFTGTTVPSPPRGHRG
jgi:lipopolysaccharide/colanic/teichoic acid biosynthesis glycosyltransferase